MKISSLVSVCILFATVTFIFCTVRPISAQPSSRMPDLDVLCVGMSPRFSPVIRKASLHQGEPVWFTAIVRNSGDATAKSWSYEWLLDGKIVSSGKTNNPLKAGQSITIHWGWHWRSGRHYVRFIADPMYALPDSSFENNTLQVATDGWSMLWIVGEKTCDAFNSQRNFLGTQSFVDWAQWHIDRMNQLFDVSPGPASFKNAISPRIRCDRIMIVKDPLKTYRQLACNPKKSILHDYDAVWVCDSADMKSVRAASPDWNLLRDWALALGVVPDNAFDRHASNNLAPDKDGAPLLISYNSPMDHFLMGNPGPTPFSRESMGALYTLYHKNTHNPAQYLYCLPRTCGVRILDALGKPVAGAHLTLRLDHNGSYSQTITAHGITNRYGEFTLPNRAVPATIRRKYHIGGGNPFGVISDHANSVFLITISARKQVEYHWLSVPQLNCAYWSGETNRATITYRTHIPSLQALPAPATLTGYSDRSRIILKWKPVPKAVAYRLYRTVTSDCRYQSVGNIRGTSWSGKFGTEPMDRFVVCAIGTNGRESAYSTPLRLVHMKDPWGLVVGENGRRYIKDADWAQILVQNRNGAWIGLMGSKKDHMEGSYDIAPYAKGRILVALRGNDADPRPGFAILSSDCGILLLHRQPQGNAPGEFNSPMGIAANSSGDIFVADTNNGRVQEFTSHGKYIRSIGVGELQNPMKVAFDRRGRLYVVDFYTNKINIYTPQTGGGYRLTGKLDGVKEPVYAAVDKYGRVFSSSHRFAAIHMFDTAGEDVWVWSGTKQNHLSGPRAIAFTKDGYILVVDDALEKILKVKAPGIHLKLKPVEGPEGDDKE